MKSKTTFKGELIGTFVEVISSQNKDVIGIKGKVIDETYNMIELENHKKIIKNQVILKVNSNENIFMLDGNLIVGRSEERIKK